MSSGNYKRMIGLVLIAIGFLGLSLYSPFFSTPKYSLWIPRGYRDTLQSPLTMDYAIEISEDYLDSLNNKDLAIDEIMEFELNFYIVYYEKNTGIGAFEMIIDKTDTDGMMKMMGDDYIRPEQGPNMMWNIKYGMHSMMDREDILNNTTITEEQAEEYAQRYLDKYLPNTIAEDAHPFYGYYTIHVMMDGKIYGMLSVNSYTGEVWYHNWHGAYVQSQEIY